MGATITTNASAADQGIAGKGYVHPEVLVSTAWLAEHLDDPSIRIIESDEDVLLYDTGHIPGAVNVDSATFYDAKTNRLKPQAELASLAASAVPLGPTVAYCNTGHWAATDWFVLSEVLGRKDVKLYYGSMVDWTSDASRPLASARTKWDDLKKKLGFGS